MWKLLSHPFPKVNILIKSYFVLGIQSHGAPSSINFTQISYFFFILKTFTINLLFSLEVIIERKKITP